MLLPDNHHDVAKSVRDRLESVVPHVAVGDEYQTDRGVKHFVVANGKLKIEGVEVEAAGTNNIAVIARRCVNQALSQIKPDDTRLVWRRMPRFSVTESGYQLDFRMAWD